MPSFKNIAAYKFVALTELGPLRGRLLSFCKTRGLKGTILISPEGINLFIAGAPERVDELIAELRTLPDCAELEVKASFSEHQPFNRMLVRIKKEIIAFGVEGIDPAVRTSPKLPPKTLKEWLDAGREVLLLDTRNDYEVKLGTFRGAKVLGIDHFREFPNAVEKLPADLKERPIVMFCTGGIRCEKAGPYMQREGFQHIYQLEGGILKYFEECGSAHYDGECFVFDQRVGVNPDLAETDSTQCFVCQSPLTDAEQKDPRYVANVSCPHCFKTPEEAMRAQIEKRHDAIRRATSPLPGSQPYDNLRPVTIPRDCEGKTIAEAMAQIVVHIDVSDWEKACAAQRILDGEKNPVTAQHRVQAGEFYFHKIPGVVEPDVSTDVQILHEDTALIVVHKPAPLPMHGAGRFNRNTLHNFLLAAYAPENPRPAHRLDANTTGIVVFTRTRRFASKLQPQFEEGRVEKIYLTRCAGHPASDAFFCDAPIGEEATRVGGRDVDFENGQEARTEFRVLRRDADGTALLEARPLTGRTNQIRVHLWHLGTPVVGDPAYLPEKKLGTTQTLAVGVPPLCLQSAHISFVHPLTNERVTFSAPKPAWA